ncbi:hypothetical protein INT47_007700 [Mucor saturninus]|uniref:Uncharacterized protein n=1 Tax=Mucor saturninus TaxID=64648 RepID=A0A8H7QYA2_9FUNG|nr:hypothetical protein INT47_007700 [Mucor saturninus]
MNVFDSVLHDFRFFTSYRGRSVILLLLGSIVFSLSHLVLLVVSVTLFSFGFIYMILSFIPTAFSAKPIVENWQNWQEYSAEGLDLDRPMNQKNSIDNATRLKLSMIERPPSCILKPV